MTINYTTLLGLAQPVTGTEAGTWGDTVNDAITALVEEAVAGGETIDVTSGDVTLTSTAGTANQARNAILLVTGTPGTSRNVIAPSSSKVYIVRNGSDGAIVLKGSATTGVTIPVGVEALCFWNGSDFEIAGMTGPSSATDNAIARFDGTTGKVVQNSVVTIADSTGDISGVGQLNATTLDATNLEVTNIKAKDGTAAASIADSTGKITVSTELAVDNLNLAGNTLSSTDSNGNIVLAPNGTGDVQLDADTVRIGDSNANATLTTNGTSDLILNTNAGTNSSSITIQDAANGNIVLAPNGTGRVQVSGTSSNAGGIELFEDTDNGTNKALVTAPAALSADVTLTLPATTSTLGYLNAPAVGTKTGSYTLATTDVGKYVQVSTGGSITIPDATFAEGDLVSIFNNTTGAITITCTITTAYIAGTDADKATVSLATRGVATILFISSTVCVITGNVS